MGKNNYDDGGIYNQQRNDEIADSISQYVEFVERLCILEGRDKDDVKKAIKVVKKAAKNLRNGKPEKVFDEEGFNEYIDNSY